MFHYVWPIALVILANTAYQVCAKGVPSQVSPFAALTVTYLVGALFSTLLHFILMPDKSLLQQIAQMNWAPYILGLSIVGLEVGWIYAYQAGWQISTGNIIQSAFLAVVLIFVGAFFYQEAVTWNKVLGIVICLIGLAVINIK